MTYKLHSEWLMDMDMDVGHIQVEGKRVWTLPGA